jgi:hypothetical protein
MRSGVIGAGASGDLVKWHGGVARTDRSITSLAQSHNPFRICLIHFVDRAALKLESLSSMR